MNRIILLLIISDILILSAFGLIAPIFAIFMNQGISGGSITAAGIASSVFFITKSATQLPLSYYLDKKRDKLTFLILGTLLIVLVPVIYALAPHVKFIYAAEAIYGLGAAMSYPAWFSLFTSHVDRKHQGFEWSLWGTGTGVGAAITAYVGAKLAEIYGFRNLFFSVSLMAFIGMIMLFFLSKKYMKEVDKIGVMFGKLHFIRRR